MNLQSDSETRRPRPRPGCPLLLLTQQLAVHQKELQQFYQKKTKVDLQITDPGIPWLHQFRHGASARRRHRNLSCCGFLVFPALPINSHMVHFRNLNWRYLTWVSHSKPKAWASPTKISPMSHEKLDTRAFSADPSGGGLNDGRDRAASLDMRRTTMTSSADREWGRWNMKKWSCTKIKQWGMCWWRS